MTLVFSSSVMLWISFTTFQAKVECLHPSFPYEARTHFTMCPSGLTSLHWKVCDWFLPLNCFLLPTFLHSVEIDWTKCCSCNKMYLSLKGNPSLRQMSFSRKKKHYFSYIYISNKASKKAQFVEWQCTATKMLIAFTIAHITLKVLLF